MTAVVMLCGSQEEGALRDRWGCFWTGEDETTGGMCESCLSQGPAGLGLGGQGAGGGQGHSPWTLRGQAVP